MDVIGYCSIAFIDIPFAGGDLGCSSWTGREGAHPRRQLRLPQSL